MSDSGKSILNLHPNYSNLARSLTAREGKTFRDQLINKIAFIVTNYFRDDSSQKNLEKSIVSDKISQLEINFNCLMTRQPNKLSQVDIQQPTVALIPVKIILPNNVAESYAFNSDLWSSLARNLTLGLQSIELTHEQGSSYIYATTITCTNFNFNTLDARKLEVKIVEYN
jgi:hypothetical protein